MNDKQNKDAQVKKLGAIIFLVVAIIYCISPIDIIPDAIPVAGWIDDGGIIFAAIMLLRKSNDAAKLILQEQERVQNTKAKTSVAIVNASNNSNAQKETKQKKEQEVNKELDLF